MVHPSASNCGSNLTDFTSQDRAALKGRRKRLKARRTRRQKANELARSEGSRNCLAAAKVTGIDPKWPFAPHRKVHASRLGASPPKSKPGTTYRLWGRSALTASAFWARVSRRGPCATLRSKSAALTARTGGSNTTRAARASPPARLATSLEFRAQGCCFFCSVLLFDAW